MSSSSGPHEGSTRVVRRLPGEAARALFRFNLPTEVAGCTRELATRRLYHESSTEGRTLDAVPIAEAWKEQTLTWATQPATASPPASAVAGQGGGYLRWDVTTQVAAAHNGFLIRRIDVKALNEGLAEVASAVSSASRAETVEGAVSSLQGSARDLEVSIEEVEDHVGCRPDAG